MTRPIQCLRCKAGEVKQILFSPGGIVHQRAWETIATQHFVVYCDQPGCSPETYSYHELPKEMKEALPRSWNVDKGTETTTDN